MIHAPDCQIIFTGASSAPADKAVFMVGDVVALGHPDQADEQLLEGTIIEIFAGDRFKVEIVDIEGRVFRYSVPSDLIVLVRRADA